MARIKGMEIGEMPERVARTERTFEPHKFAEIMRAVRTAEAALGEARYGPKEAEANSLRFRRSLFVVEDIRAGEPSSTANVRSIRPADGLHTRHLDEVLGRPADIERDTPLTLALIRRRLTRQALISLRK